MLHFRNVGGWARRGSSKPLVNFRLIIRALCYLNRKYHIIQVIPIVQNIIYTFIYRT